MTTPDTRATPSPATKSPDSKGTPASPTPTQTSQQAEDLDLEEDIAPNLGGEDQMQDA